MGVAGAIYREGKAKTRDVDAAVVNKSAGQPRRFWWRLFALCNYIQLRTPALTEGEARQQTAWDA
jgi:hypothetical protein